jgi:hypothetical protein
MATGSKKNKARGAADSAAKSAQQKRLDAVTSCDKKRQKVLEKYNIVMKKYKHLKEDKKRGYQREHIPPNSCFVKGPGRKGPTVDGAGDYDEGEAMTFFVYDNQRAGTEHKVLTDKERQFAQSLEEHDPPKQATVTQWLDEMEKAIAEMYSSKEVKRTRRKAQARFTKAEAVLIARCIRMEIQDNLKALDVDMNTKLRNGMVGGDEPKPRKQKRSKRKKK